MSSRGRSLLAALTAAGVLAGHAGAAVPLTRAGQPVARVHVPAGLAESADLKPLAEAVQELTNHLARMSGAVLEVVETADAAAIKGPAIVLGDLAVRLGATPERTTESLEGFRLLTRGDRLLIGGQSPLAVRHGVYEALRRLGCDWVMPGEIGCIVPTRADVQVPDLDESQAPDFLFRRLWYRGYPQPRKPGERDRMNQWLARQKGGTWTHPASTAGGHAWPNLIRKHKAAFDADPTMLALVRAPDGSLVRRGPQLEATHPKVAELYSADIRETYRKNIEAGKWTKDTPFGFPIGPADGLGYSLSSEAMTASAGRIDPIVGELDRTDELVLLGNRILEDVTRDYPNAMVGFYSYSVHSDYPARYQPHPNLVQIFAPINFSRFHSVLDPNSKSQAYYRDVVRQWAKLSREQGNPLIYRGYNWNLADNMLPFTKVRIWGEELPFYKENHVLGMNVEATKSWSILAPSDYVFMRLAWDCSQDWRELLKTFCDHAYGAGAAAMRRYHQRVIDTQHGAGQEAGSYHAFNLIYDADWVAAARRDIAEARAAAKTDGDRTRIGHAAHNVEALALYLDYHAATRAFDFAAAQRGYEAMLAHWQQAYDANSDLVANETPQYLKRFVLRFVEAAAKYSSAPYKIVHRIPDELPTFFDPQAVGHRMQYHHPSVNDAQAIRTRTFSTTWDAQGLGGIRDGAVWYRIWFELPADAGDEPVGLFIGGVEDEARVWINGKAIGTSGRGFSLPFLFDLTDGIARKGKNLLAIQVARNSKANEIGLGGIIRPCFVFTGPRLESAAPKTLELRRVLPGGELGDWLARCCGIDTTLSAVKVRRHLLSVVKHNLKRTLADHSNPQRPTYALGGEGGLLLCSWPGGGKPSLPFVYSDEVWTGIEYQVAAHLVMLGRAREGLAVVRTVRRRYDGRVRNPFNEYECGHWYARAMSSYSLLQAFSGARYDAVDRTLALDPAMPGDFRAFLCTATGYGTVGRRGGQPFLDVVSGTIPVERIIDRGAPSRPDNPVA